MAKMLTLYKAGNSICTQKVFITLREKKLDWDEINVDLFRNEQYGPAFLKINPKGVVPALIHDGKIVNESTLICEYLDEVFPQPALMPADAYDRTRVRMWSKAIDEEIFEATREISFSAMFRERMRTMTEEQRETRFRNVGDPGRRARFMSTYEQGAESPFVFEGIAAFEKLFAKMSDALSGGSPWLLGRDLTLADINVVPFVARLAYLNLLSVWIDDRPDVMRWWERAQSLPTFKASVSDLLTANEFAAMHDSGTRIKDRIRTLRAEYLRQRSSDKASSEATAA
jgi:ganglioside-induced differentiation-associated protein 1